MILLQFLWFHVVMLLLTRTPLVTTHLLEREMAISNYQHPMRLVSWTTLTWESDIWFHEFHNLCCCSVVHYALDLQKLADQRI